MGIYSRIPNKLYSRPESNSSIGQPRCYWMDDIEADLCKLGVRNWKRFALSSGDKSRPSWGCGTRKGRFILVHFELKSWHTCASVSSIARYFRNKLWFFLVLLRRRNCEHSQYYIGYSLVNLIVITIKFCSTRGCQNGQTWLWYRGSVLKRNQVWQIVSVESVLHLGGAR